MPDRKIATCCYCGSRTVLTLTGRVRHQLACSACGAPLTAMKALRLDPDPPPRRASGPQPSARPAPRPAAPEPRRRRRKPFVKRALDRIEDLVEDLLDIFD